MHPRQNPPWSELLRECAAGNLPPAAFAMKTVLKTDRLEARTVGVTLVGGANSVQLPPVFACPCGLFAVGEPGAAPMIDDLASPSGAPKVVDLLVAAMRQLRPELRRAPEALLRTVATNRHAQLVEQLAVHATRWNLPPYASMGRSRARPAKCLHEP